MHMTFVAIALVLGSQAPVADSAKPGTVAGSKDSKVTIRIDTSEVPELAPWGEEAKQLAEHWYPIITELLATDGFTPPGEVTIVFKKDMRGVAATSGRRIRIAADWVKRHPDDKGMVIHELTHVIQSYPRHRAVWLSEGIADDIRFNHFEPETRLTLGDPDRASYRDGYRTTAMFLGWLARTHDKEIVRELNRALREGKYHDELFRELTTKSLDELWDEFVASER